MSTFTYLLRKVLVAFLSTVFLIIVFGVLNMIFYRTPSIWEAISFFFIFVFPAYLLGGAPYSMFVDLIWNKWDLTKMSKYLAFLLNIIIYAIGGWLISMLYLMILTSGNLYFDPNLRFYFFGVFAAIVYYLIDQWFVWITERYKLTITKK